MSETANARQTTSATPADSGAPDRPGGEVVVYRTEDGHSRIDVRLDGGTVWLPQSLIAELFETTVPNVNIHLKNIYAEGELQAEATIKECLMIRQVGTRHVSRRGQPARGHAWRMRTTAHRRVGRIPGTSAG